MPKNQPYKMSLSLNVLNHLGIYLYSNIPAVLSEIVANAWDADAENVEIEVDAEKKRIVIKDDGHGMTADDVNNKYLRVGYSRRSKAEGCITPKWNRPVMGRKGIGKLSLFSIARSVEVHTVKDGEKNGFMMLLDEIRQKIEGSSDNEKSQSGDYYPASIDKENISVSKGTEIILTDLKKELHQTIPALRKRLARRFSIIGEEYHFKVSINGSPIDISDRDYFHKLQYLWYFGEESEKYCDQANNLEPTEEGSPLVNPEQRTPLLPNSDLKLCGWIGSVKESGDLKDADDNLNKIVLMVRGKLAQEDILEEFNEGGLYTKYLIGELHADFLDLDDKEDIATSNRQKIIEDDPRYQSLRSFVYQELKHIQNSWSALRDAEGAKKALDIQPIKDWFKTLRKEEKVRAKALFGKINRLTIDSPQEKRRLLKYSVLAFESLKYKDNLDALERISPENLEVLGEIFSSLDDIEKTLYHQIVRERVQVIKTLQEKVEDDAREKAIQQHIFKHLWLLDPSWERATETPYMEQVVEKEFEKINAKLTDEEKKGRVDIKYTTTSGKHVIVELKRAARQISS